MNISQSEWQALHKLSPSELKLQIFEILQKASIAIQEGGPVTRVHAPAFQLGLRDERFQCPDLLSRCEWRAGPLLQRRPAVGAPLAASRLRP